MDDNSFKLSNIGAATTNKEIFYNTNRYVDLTSVGSETHNFNYQDITVSLIGKVGISSIGTETFKARVESFLKEKLLQFI